MKKVINISEIVETVDLPEGPCEVCAGAEAEHDEMRGRLIVRAGSFVRTADLRRTEKQVAAPWLPKPEIIEEAVARGEAVTVAKDIFRSWVQKVRRSIPSVHNPQSRGEEHVTKIHH